MEKYVEMDSIVVLCLMKQIHRENQEILSSSSLISDKDIKENSIEDKSNNFA